MADRSGTRARHACDGEYGHAFAAAASAAAPSGAPAAAWRPAATSHAPAARESCEEHEGTHTAARDRAVTPAWKARPAVTGLQERGSVARSIRRRNRRPTSGLKAPGIQDRMAKHRSEAPACTADSTATSAVAAGLVSLSWASAPPVSL